MATYNVTAMLVFNAENEDEAQEMAENALSLIPKDVEPDLYEVCYADLNHE